MNIALDIDDTITAYPESFSMLSQAPGVDKTIVISSRSNRKNVRRQTIIELATYQIRFSQLFLLEDISAVQCPHMELDWYQKYLWQKVAICQAQSVDLIVEDDPKVIQLFQSYAPRIRVLQMHRGNIP